MALAQKPYWIRVINHFQNKNYITNGLTIPFLIGCRSKVYPSEPRYSIDEFLCQLMLSRYKVTVMTCPNIGHIVIGAMDTETKMVAENGVYRNFGGIYIIDDTFKDAIHIDDVIRQCQHLYSNVIAKDLYSLENGGWSYYSESDTQKLDEVSEVAVIAMVRARENKSDTDTKLDEIIQRHQIGTLESVVPLWHININELNFDDQPENLPAARMCKGIEIIQDVNFELLLDNMFPERAADYRKKELFHELLDDRKIARVINHWLNGEKLIPPTITFEERMEQEKNLFPAEGKHRLNVAYHYGASHIPIVILTSEKGKILPLLNK
jgi:hypothetical protein